MRHVVASVEPAGDSAVLKEEDRRIDFDTEFSNSFSLPSLS